jgi:hypothetical protein
VLTN